MKGGHHCRRNVNAVSYTHLDVYKRQALQRMAEIAVKEAGTTKDKRLVIAHCNAPERARFMKEKLCSMAEFKEVVITDTCGVSTVYASDGGVILAL